MDARVAASQGSQVETVKTLLTLGLWMGNKVTEVKPIHHWECRVPGPPMLLSGNLWENSHGRMMARSEAQNPYPTKPCIINSQRDSASMAILVTAGEGVLEHVSEMLTYSWQGPLLSLPFGGHIDYFHSLAANCTV